MIRNVPDSASLVSKQLDAHNLRGLKQIISRRGCFIAGSYTIPLQELTLGQGLPDDRDIDIWIPTTSHTNQLTVVSELTQYMVHRGYAWPVVHSVRNTTELGTSSYRRLEHSIRKMFTLRHATDRTAPYVQFLLLTEQAGHTPEEVVGKFDLTLLKRWYDGTNLFVSPDARDALRERQLILNVSSNDFRQQSMSEWVRTARRLQKYSARNFTIQWNSDLDELLLDAFARNIYHIGPRDSKLRLPSMERWNTVIRDLSGRLPFLAVTVCHPAKTLADVRVVRAMNERLLMDSDSRVHWKELTQQEQESALPIGMPRSHMNKGTFLVETIVRYALNGSDSVTYDENVDTFIELPKFEVYPYPLNRTQERDTTVFSFRMGEFVDETGFRDANPEDHVIIVGPDGTKFGLLRSQIWEGKLYMTCTTPEVVIPVPICHDRYIPLEQLISALESSFVYFGVHAMGIRSVHPISRKQLDDGSFVSAEHCTDRQIWNIYAIHSSTRYRSLPQRDRE